MQDFGVIDGVNTHATNKAESFRNASVAESLESERERFGRGFGVRIGPVSAIVPGIACIRFILKRVFEKRVVESVGSVAVLFFNGFLNFEF